MMITKKKTRVACWLKRPKPRRLRINDTLRGSLMESWVFPNESFDIPAKFKIDPYVFDESIVSRVGRVIRVHYTCVKLEGSMLSFRCPNAFSFNPVWFAMLSIQDECVISVGLKAHSLIGAQRLLLRELKARGARGAVGSMLDAFVTRSAGRKARA